jgi:hypothetical protein
MIMAASRWAHVSKMYDDGRVVFSGVFPVNPDVESGTVRGDGFELCTDVFESKADAKFSLKSKRDEAYPGFSDEFPDYEEV